MNLTKEDLVAIGSLIDEKVGTLIEQKVGSLIDEKLEANLAPLRKMFKQILNAQVDIVDHMELMDAKIKLVMFHLNLSPESRELRKTLKDLE